MGDKVTSCLEGLTCVCGIDIIGALVEEGEELLSSFFPSTRIERVWEVLNEERDGLRVCMEVGDLMEKDLSPFSCLYIASLLFSHATKQALERKLIEELRAGAIVITLHKLEHTIENGGPFNPWLVEEVTMTWGRCEVYVYELT